jgi:hypothetical protein
MKPSPVIGRKVLNKKRCSFKEEKHFGARSYQLSYFHQSNLEGYGDLVGCPDG